MLWQCPRLKWMPLTLHIFEPFSHAFLLLLKVVRNCTAWAQVLGGLPRIPAKKALPLFLGRMQSSRSFKRGNKSSSPGREMKDKTKRIKCFGCEHISFHFLLLVSNNAPIFRMGGGICPEKHLRKNIPQVFSGDHDNWRDHLALSLSTLQTSFFLRCWLGKMSLPGKAAQSKAEEGGEGNFTTHSPNASSAPQRHILFCTGRRWKLVTFPLSASLHLSLQNVGMTTVTFTPIISAGPGGPNRAGHKDPRSDLWSLQASVASGLTLLFQEGREGEEKERGLFLGLSSQ